MNTGSASGTRLQPAIWAALFLALTLFVFGPSHIFLTNAKEFYFVWSELLLTVIPIAGGTTLLALAILNILRRRPSSYQKAVSLLVVLGVLLWIQGNVLVHRLGPLDGREIDWGARRLRSVADGASWAIVLIVGYVRSSFFFKQAKRISAALIAVQVLSTGWLTGTQWGSSQRWQYAMKDDHAFVFSKQENVIVFVLDTFQGDILAEILSEDARYAEALDGFTFFRNSLGGYPATYPAVPFMLTGIYYDNSVPMRVFLKEAYLSGSSIPRTLVSKGYRVDLFGEEHVFHASDEVASNFGRRGIKLVRPEELACVLDVALFRYAPLPAKEYIFNDDDWLLSSVWARLNTRRMPWQLARDIKFAERMAREARADSKQPTFKVYRLWVPHPPFRMNERLHYEKMDWTRESFRRQSRAALSLVISCLETLKRLGVYDRSLILLVGDHGLNGHLPGRGGDGCAWLPEDLRAREDGRAKLVPEAVQSSGIPLVLAKRFNASGPMRVSDVPISLGDVPRTIASELNLDGAFQGRSFFEIEESEDRERRFLWYSRGHTFAHGEYLPSMNEYAVLGHSLLNSSWRRTYRQFRPRELVYNPLKTVQFGEPVAFGRGGNSGPYQGCGWSPPESGFTWTFGKSAHLGVPLPDSEGDVVMRANLQPMLVQGRVDRQRVSIRVAGEAVGSWEVSRAGEYEIRIPRSYLRSSMLELTFELPDATSPYETGVGEDRRVLALAVRTIVFDKAQLAAPQGAGSSEPAPERDPRGKSIP